MADRPPSETVASGGRALGELNRRRFAEWLESAEAIPSNASGGAHVSELERLLGIPRNAFYTNPGLRRMLEEAVAKKGLRPIGGAAAPRDATESKLEARIKTLEERLDAERASNRELRTRLRRLEALEAALATTGRALR